MIERVHIIIAIVAALFVSITCLITNVGLTDSALKISITILSFYFLGYFVKSYFKRSIFVEEHTYDYEDDVPPTSKVEQQVEPPNEMSEQQI